MIVNRHLVPIIHQDHVTQVSKTFRNWGARRQARIPAHGWPQCPHLARVFRHRPQICAARSTPFRLRSRPCLRVSGKVHFTSAAGHFPSVRGRRVGRLHDAWSSSIFRCASRQRARLRRCGSATRCRNGAANHADAGPARKVAGLVSLPLPQTTCAIVSGGGLPRERFQNQLQRQGQRQ